MAVEIVIGIALAALVVGVAGGFFLGKGRGNSEKVKELESALAKSQTELSDYRGEVFGQFAETAEKFKALDASYQDLHRQLAASSVALCGDDATPLLPGPERDLLNARENETWEEKQVEDAADASEEDGPERAEENTAQHTAEKTTKETAEETTKETAEETTKETAEETAESTDEPTQLAAATGADDSLRDHKERTQQDIAQSVARDDGQDGNNELEDELKDELKDDIKDDILVAESTDVPVLTDVEKDLAAAERADDEAAARKTGSR